MPGWQNNKVQVYAGFCINLVVVVNGSTSLKDVLFFHLNVKVNSTPFQPPDSTLPISLSVCDGSSCHDGDAVYSAMTSNAWQSQDERISLNFFCPGCQMGNPSFDLRLSAVWKGDTINWSGACENKLNHFALGCTVTNEPVTNLDSWPRNSFDLTPEIILKNRGKKFHLEAHPDKNIQVELMKTDQAR